MTDLTEAEIVRGVKAQQLLAEPLLVEAFEVLKREILEKWQSSPARDEAGREKLFLMLKATERVERHLTSVVETGRIADATLRQKLARATGRDSTAF